MPRPRESTRTGVQNHKRFSRLKKIPDGLLAARFEKGSTWDSPPIGPTTKAAHARRVWSVISQTTGKHSAARIPAYPQTDALFAATARWPSANRRLMHGIKIHNERGEFVAKAHVTDDLPPRVV